MLELQSNGEYMIKGFLYKKDSSLSEEAILSIVNDTYYLKINQEVIITNKIHTLCINPRIANTQREIKLNEDSLFLTNENDIVDKLLLKKKNTIYKIESNIFLVLLSFIIFVFLCVLFFKFGIPYITNKIANNIPSSINKKISENTLNLLDEYILEKSEVAESKKEYLKKMFNSELIAKLNSNKEISYKLMFRQLNIDDKPIANALALSDGKIIVTDELINLSKNTDEIKAILLHEIGHIEEKHIQKILTRNSLIAILSMLILGDNSAVSDLGIGVGAILISSEHSREIETQADTYAFEKMLELKINPNNFINIMNKITNTDEEENENKYLQYFSSHPNTILRTKRAEVYQKCFNENKTICLEQEF